MNAAHLELCASPEWRQMVEELVLPAALGDLDLGDDVLEIGPGPGFTTDVLRTRAVARSPRGFSAATSFNMLHHVPTDELQDRIFSELARVLRSGGIVVAADGVGDEGTRAFHEGDTYNPVDPDTLRSRLAGAGFVDPDVRGYDLGWVCTARAPYVD